ncbi:hypothetical protein PMAYCL1PPCAC_29530, partial [Pristionchus mayeri]
VEKGGSASVEKLSNEKASGSKEKSKEKESGSKEKDPETDLRLLQSTQSSTKKTEFTPSSCSNTQHNSNTAKSQHVARHFKDIPKPEKRVTAMNMKFGSGETIGSAEILKDVKMGASANSPVTQSTQKSSSEALKSQMTQLRSVAQPVTQLTQIKSVKSPVAKE